MERSQNPNTNINSNPNPNPNRTLNPVSSPIAPLWPTIDASLGLSEEESVTYARGFYKFGFALLPFLWAVNCFYFWPVLRDSHSFPRIRPYIVGSAIGFAVFMAILSSWALTFSIGGERLFGPVWDKLVMYNVADKLGLTGRKILRDYSECITKREKRHDGINVILRRGDFSRILLYPNFRHICYC